MKRFLFTATLLLFSFKPSQEQMWLDAAVARKKNTCGYWVRVQKDFELKLLQYNTALDDWIQLNNTTTLPNSGLWFFPDRDQKTCKKHLKVVPKKNWISPLATPLIKTSGIGERWLKRKHNIHYGVDLATPVGSTVFALSRGVVTAATWNKKLGNYIVLQTDFGFRVVYGHLSKRLVEVGEQVETGQIIATSGNTGWSTGPHLHLEVRNAVAAIDPLVLLQH